MTIGQICDLVIVLLFLVGIVRGWFVGLAVKIGHLAALIASCVTAHIAGEVLKTFLSEKVVLPYLEKHSNGILDSVQVLENGVKAFAEKIGYDLVFFIVFLISLLIFNHVVHLLKLIDHIPVVGTLNKFGGALLGFVTQFIMVYILCLILFTFVPEETFRKIGLTKAEIHDTMILQYFVNPKYFLGAFLK